MSTADKSECKKNCSTCAHWFAPLRSQQVGIGQCRESAPISSFSWPRTREDDACSKHKPITDAGAGAPSPQAGANACDHDPEHGADAKAEAGATAGPAFARGKGAPRPRR